MTTVTVNIPATTVQVPASTVQYALQLSDCIATLLAANYTVTAPVVTPPPPPPPPPTGVVATANPFTVSVAFTYTPPAGKTVASYSAAGVGSASFMVGSSTHSPILLQGVNGAWAGGSMPVAVTAHFSDGTTAAVGTSNSVSLQATNGSVLTTSPNVYVNGQFDWKGNFPFNGAAIPMFGTDYFDTSGVPSASPGGASQYCMKFTPAAGTGGGLQLYAPVASLTAAYDLTPYNFLEVDLKPLVSGTTWDMYFEQYGDVAVGSQITIGQGSVAGQWKTYKIPLSSAGVTGKKIMKFAMAVAAGQAFWANNVKFSAT